MHPKIQSIQVTRANVIKLLEAAGTAGSNIIPPGFNNNIVWNFGHMLATQQMVNYSRPGLPLPLGDAVVNKYMRGTKPDGPADAAEIAGLIAFSDASLARLEQDFDAGVLRAFEPFTTPLG